MLGSGDDRGDRILAPGCRRPEHRGRRRGREARAAAEAAGERRPGRNGVRARDGEDPGRDVMAADEVTEPVEGDGYAVGNIDAIGEGYGFRKIRRELGVTAFGVNAIVMPAGYESGSHVHDEQEELYFVHRGRIEFEFGGGAKHVLGEGGVARVDAATVRKMK